MQGKENDEKSRQVEQRRTNEKERAFRLISRLIEEIKAIIYLTNAEREYLKIDNPYQNNFQVLADATEMRFTKG